MFSRRALFALTSSIIPGATMPSAVRADDVPPPPLTTTPPLPVVPPTVVPPSVLPPSVLPPSVLPPAAVPPAPIPTPPITPVPRPVAGAPAAIDRTKAYFVFYEQTIDVPSIRVLRRQLTSLAEAGVTDVTLVIQSPGGLVFQAIAAYSFIRALPMRIDTHATGLVASAACLLFLAGQNRSADRTARFLFHPSQVPVAGTLTGQQMHERLAQFDAADAMVAQTYHDRTSLTDADISRFGREEVFYNAEQAQAAGIVQSVADLHIPGEQKSRVLILE